MHDLSIILKSISREKHANAGATAGTGALLGGGLGGIIAGAAFLGGSALSEIFRSYNERKNNELFAQQLAQQLKNMQINPEVF